MASFAGTSEPQSQLEAEHELFSVLSSRRRLALPLFCGVSVCGRTE